MKSQNLNRLLSKLEPVYHLRDGQWYGQVTPVEYMELIKWGARHSYYTNGHHLEYIKDYVKRGEGGHHVIYFTPTGRLKEMLGKRYPNHDERGH